MRFPKKLIALAASLLTSCGALRPARTPIRSVTIRSGGPGRCLAVMLPGRFAPPESFTRGGFHETAARLSPDLDLIAVDAHLGYYRTRTLIDRIREDVILPARARGYEEIWLVGTSLGGLGSMIYLREHPEDVAGVLAIAPYLGEDDVVEEVARAGGPLEWKAPATVADDDIGRILWKWIGTGAIARGNVPFHLGWGRGDRFDRSNRLLATMVPPERTYAVEGAHDLPTWNRVWSEFLERARPCGSERP